MGRENNQSAVFHVDQHHHAIIEPVVVVRKVAGVGTCKVERSFVTVVPVGNIQLFVGHQRGKLFLRLRVIDAPKAVRNPLTVGKFNLTLTGGQTIYRVPHLTALIPVQRIDLTEAAPGLGH